MHCGNILYIATSINKLRPFRIIDFCCAFSLPLYILFIFLACRSFFSCFLNSFSLILHFEYMLMMMVHRHHHLVSNIKRMSRFFLSYFWGHTLLKNLLLTLQESICLLVLLKIPFSPPSCANHIGNSYDLSLMLFLSFSIFHCRIHPQEAFCMDN